MGKRGRRRRRARIPAVQRVHLSLAPPATQMTQKVLQAKKMDDVGTGNPIAARLSMQMFDLVDGLGLPKADRDAIFGAHDGRKPMDSASREEHLTIGLRLFFKAVGMVLTGRPTGWKDMKAAIEQGFGPAHPLRVLLATHGGWSKAL